MEDNYAQPINTTHIASNTSLKQHVWDQALERESQRVDSLHNQDVGLLENFWKNKSAFDIQMDVHE